MLKLSSERGSAAGRGAPGKAVVRMCVRRGAGSSMIAVMRVRDEEEEGGRGK